MLLSLLLACAIRSKELWVEGGELVCLRLAECEPDVFTSAEDEAACYDDIDAVAEIYSGCLDQFDCTYDAKVGKAILLEYREAACPDLAPDLYSELFKAYDCGEKVADVGDCILSSF
ncbi:MAG TPA: hypothetical protein PKW90_09275 [Myxococcota bacterium]|nr:hypothetical protein [Myxococcota bacterium]